MGHLFTFWHMMRQHKYAVVFVIFLAVVGFIDDDSIMVRYQRQVEIRRLHREIDKYVELYDSETAQLQAIETSSDAIEHLAREKYFMKRPGEDIFVFEEPDNEQ